MNFTLKPFTNVGYNIKSTEENDDIGSIERYYEGTGGTYKFVSGVGARYKNFSVGVNVGYFLVR
ncbi:MAG: hypothetical protein R2771_03620 [Saprospiraceae bacterium]